MNAPNPHDQRALRKLIGLTALGIAALCAAVFLAIESREAAAAPLPVATLRIGITPTHLPVSTGERDYTNGSFDAAYARELAQQLDVQVELVPLPAMRNGAHCGRGGWTSCWHALVKPRPHRRNFACSAPATPRA